MVKTKTGSAVFLFLCLFSGWAGAAGDGYLRGLQAFRNGDYRGAVSFLEESVVQRPDPAAYYMLGYASYQLHDFQKAREYFEAAYLIDPGFTGAGLFARPEVPDEERELVLTVLELSGARGQLGYYAGLVVRGASSLAEGPQEQKFGKDMTALVKDAYRAERLFPVVVNVFQSGYNKKHLSAALAWLKTPAGRKMGVMTALNPSEVFKEIERYAPEFRRLGEVRKRLFARLERATEASDMNSSVFSGPLSELKDTLNLRSDVRSRMGPKAGVGSVSRDQLTASVVMSLAFRYRDLSDEELEAAVAFYETTSGRWFAETGLKAMTFALTQASMQVNGQLSRHILAKQIPI